MFCQFFSCSVRLTLGKSTWMRRFTSCMFELVDVCAGGQSICFSLNLLWLCSVDPWCTQIQTRCPTVLLLSLYGGSSFSQMKLYAVRHPDTQAAFSHPPKAPEQGGGQKRAPPYALKKERERERERETDLTSPFDLKEEDRQAERAGPVSVAGLIDIMLNLKSFVCFAGVSLLPLV